MSRGFVRHIKHNEKNERPNHVIFVDVESHVNKFAPNKYKFDAFLWTGIYKHYRHGSNRDTEIELSGTTIDSFWHEVDNYAFAKSKLYIVTHHLEVDFMPLGGFNKLYEYGWTLNSLISHGRVVTLYCKRDTTSLIIMNNGNLFDGSIESWGNIFKVPKLTMPSKKAPLSEWVTYCKRDTLIVKLMWDTLLNFMDEHDLGNFKATRASLAMNAYRHRFMTHDVSIHHDIPALQLERRSYHGGRFEALKFGNFKGDTYYQLDTNSMYGYIELVNKLPYELQGFIDKCPIGRLEHLLKSYAVVADVDIVSDEPYFPIREGSKVKYPTGSFNVVMCTPELLYALKKGHIKNVRSVAYYKQGLIFSEFANYFMTLKNKYTDEGNIPMRTMAKFFPNALYGKFGQYGYEDSIIGECPDNIFSIEEGLNTVTHKRYSIMAYGGKVHQTNTIDQSYYTFVAIASHITAYGRMLLFNMMKQAGLNNVYHVATDSLVVNTKGYERLKHLIHDTEPGKLKLEKTFKSYKIKGINDVVCDETEKIKGVPKKATKLADNTYLCTNWPKITTLLKEGIFDYYYTKTVTKTLNRPDYKEALRLAGISEMPVTF